MNETQAITADWFYEKNDQRTGPVPEGEMVALIKASVIAHGTPVWKQGFSDWQKIENTELHAHFDVGMPPPLSGEHVNNGIVWVLAFAPFIGLILEWLVASMLHGSGAAYAMADGKYWFVTLVLNIALSFADEKKLSSAGYDTSKFKDWLWLVPVYLYKRAKVTKQSLAYFVVWVACFVLTLFI